MSVAGGIVAVRFVHPQYTVSATVWIQSETPTNAGSTGPIRSGGLLSAQAWVELLKSYRIADAVVRKLTLYVRPDKPTDLPVFANFSIADRFAAGQYELVIDRSRKRWHLSSKAAFCRIAEPPQTRLGAALACTGYCPPRSSPAPVNEKSNSLS